MAQVDTLKGGTLKISLSITDTNIDNLIDLTVLPGLEIWAYVSPTLIYKFNRDGGTGYKQLINIDDYNYKGYLNPNETILIKNGKIRIATYVALTDLDALNNVFICLSDTETSINLLTKPISYVVTS